MKETLKSEDIAKLAVYYEILNKTLTLLRERLKKSPNTCGGNLHGSLIDEIDVIHNELRPYRVNYMEVKNAPVQAANANDLSVKLLSIRNTINVLNDKKLNFPTTMEALLRQEAELLLQINNQQSMTNELKDSTRTIEVLNHVNTMLTNIGYDFSDNLMVELNKEQMRWKEKWIKATEASKPKETTPTKEQLAKIEDIKAQGFKWDQKLTGSMCAIVMTKVVTKGAYFKGSASTRREAYIFDLEGGIKNIYDIDNF